MTRKDFELIQEKYHNGSFVRIVYTSNPTLKAAAKREGHSVTKRTETTSRFGCKYANLKGVEVKGAPDYAHSDDSIIYTHDKTGVEYLQLEPIVNANPKIQWIVDGKETTQDEAARYIVPSYFKPKEKSPVVRVKLQNVETILV